MIHLHLHGGGVMVNRASYSLQVARGITKIEDAKAHDRSLPTNALSLQIVILSEVAVREARGNAVEEPHTRRRHHLPCKEFSRQSGSAIQVRKSSDSDRQPSVSVINLLWPFPQGPHQLCVRSPFVN